MKYDVVVPEKKKKKNRLLICQTSEYKKIDRDLRHRQPTPQSLQLLQILPGAGNILETEKLFSEMSFSIVLSILTYFMPLVSFCTS